MKKLASIIFSMAFVTGSFGQNIFTYGKQAVSKDEFVKAFDKNPNLTGDRKKALQEYLDLYINFKLKVQAAYDADLDKDATQQYELQNFRNQVADNIINEEANVKELVKQAFERSRKEIHLAQVFIEVPANADTTSAFKNIHAAYKALKGGEDFDAVVHRFSNDEATKQSKGDLGYVTVFTLPYELENVVYGLNANAFSAPVRTKMGYHIFKNVGERAASGSRRVAQILIAYPPGASEAEKSQAAHKADSLYTVVTNGADFAEVAASASNDVSSSNSGGELPEFTTGTYSADFENAAFALQQTGDISKPFETSYGYHILKLLEAKPVSSDVSDPATFAALQEKVVKDSRMEMAKKALIQKLLVRINYKQAAIKEKDLFLFTDSLLQRGSAPIVKGITVNSVIFSFAKQPVKAGEWVKYVKGLQAATTGTTQPDYPQIYKQYVEQRADEYYRNNLDTYSKSYSKQVREFKEANLLFAMMERNVWSKANTDTAGLVKYYNEHQSKYRWSLSADAIIVTCKNQSVAKEMQQKLRDHLNTWRQITAAAGNDVMADSARFELGQLPVIDRTNFTAGLITAPVKNDNDGSYTFNYVIKMYPDGAPRIFEDARGIVMSDYQQVLEDKWVAALKKKYPVKVNQVVFQSIK